MSGIESPHCKDGHIMPWTQHANTSEITSKRNGPLITAAEFTEIQILAHLDSGRFFMKTNWNQVLLAWICSLEKEKSADLLILRQHASGSSTDKILWTPVGAPIGIMVN